MLKHYVNKLSCLGFVGKTFLGAAQVVDFAVKLRNQFFQTCLLILLKAFNRIKIIVDQNLLDVEVESTLGIVKSLL